MIGRALLLLLLVSLGSLVPAASGAPPTVPETTITSGPSDPIASKSASFSFASSIDGSTFGCAVDSDPFRDCTSPQTYDDLSEGLHTFFVFAVKDGIPDATPASWTWTVDTTPPPPVEAHKIVRYRHFALSWTSPASSGADHVVVLKSMNPTRKPSVQVYNGPGTSYTNSRFDNGLYHRYRITSVDRAGNVSANVDVVVPASALLLAPSNGSRVGKPPTLAWRGVASAGYYNVQLWRVGKKILSAWPKSSHLELTQKWSFGGGPQELKAGLYTWLVWPGFGPRAKGAYGRPVGQSSFRLIR